MTRKRGRPPGKKKIPLNITITPETYEMAQKVAYNADKSVSRLIEDLLRAHAPKLQLAGAGR